MKNEAKERRLDEWALKYVPTFLYRIPANTKRGYRNIKYFFQSVFRKYHFSDADLWSLYFHLAKTIHPKLKAFVDMKRIGYPAMFEEYSKNGSPWKSKEDYEKAKKEGKVAGGGEKEWNRILNEMLFAFEYVIHDDSNKKIPDFYEKWGLKDPREKIPENLASLKWYKNKDTGMGIISDGENITDEWQFEKEDKFYHNAELEREYSQRAQKGFELFGKYFYNLWD